MIVFPVKRREWWCNEPADCIRQFMHLYDKHGGMLNLGTDDIFDELAIWGNEKHENEITSLEHAYEGWFYYTGFGSSWGEPPTSCPSRPAYRVMADR